jgi:hypothetical protein
MKRFTRFALWLYPAAWRSRYRAELEALIEDSGSNWRVIADLLKESMKMPLTTGSFAKLAAGLGLAGLVLAGVTSAFIPSGYTSDAKLEITPTPGSGNQHVTEHLMQMENEILSWRSLGNIVRDPRLDLYKFERESTPLEDVIERMRREDIRIRLVSPSTFSISFRYPDQIKAQKTVQALIVKFQNENLKPVRIVLPDRGHLVVLDPPTLPRIPFLPDWQDVLPLPTWVRPGWVSRAQLEMVPQCFGGSWAVAGTNHADAERSSEPVQSVRHHPGPASRSLRTRKAIDAAGGCDRQDEREHSHGRGIG